MENAMHRPTSPQTRPQSSAGPDLAAIPAEGTQPVLASQDVLRGHKAVAISHNGALYRLQTTRQGKLILTK